MTGAGIFAKGHGGLGIPGFDAVSLDILYMAGMLSGSLEAKFSKGRLHGMLKVWLSPTHKIGGHGELSYEVVPGLPVFVGVDVLEDGRAKIAAGVRLPDPLPLFKDPKGIDKELFGHHFNIPLFGFPGVDLEAVIDVSLNADAGIGPAVIMGGEILSDFDPTAESQEVGFKAKGTLEIPAHAGVSFSMDGGLGLRVLIAKAEGTIGFTAGVKLCGALTAPVILEYKNDKFTIDACVCLMAQPCVEVEGHAKVRAYLDLWLKEVTLYRNKWNLGGFHWGSDFTLGVMFPFHYTIGDGFDLPDNNVKFITPQISLGKLLSDVLPV